LSQKLNLSVITAIDDMTHVVILYRGTFELRSC